MKEPVSDVFPKGRNGAQSSSRSGHLKGFKALFG